MRTRLSILLVFVMVLTFVPLGPAAANGYWPISEDTTLTEDYYGNIEIDADGVTLDCNGFKVVGEGFGRGISVFGRTGVTIRDCDVSGFEAGVVLAGSSGNTIEGNYIHDNVAGHWPVGIGTWGCSDNLIVGNTASNNGADGIHVMGSDEWALGNSIVGNTANGNGRFGIGLGWNKEGIVGDNNTAENTEGGISSYGSWRNVVENNETYNNGRFGFSGFGIGVYISESDTIIGNNSTGNGIGIALGSSNNSALVGNETYENSQHGVTLNGTGNRVEGNEVHNNGENGISLSESHNNEVIDNDAYENGDVGFSLGESNGNTLTGNESVENGSHGYDLWVSDGNTLEGNLAEHSGFLGGIVLTGSSFNSLVGNQSVGSDVYGFAVWAAWDEDTEDWIKSHSNVLTGNHAVGNGSGGFVTTLAYENTFEGNLAVNNHGWAGGFWFGDTEGNTLIDNSARSNRSGFQLAGAYGHDLSGNSAINNTEHGFVLWESSDNVLTGNTAINNGDKKSDDGGIGFDVSVGSVGNTLSGNRGHNNWICDAADWLKPANSWADNDLRVWCESDGDYPLLLPAWTTGGDVYEAGWILAEALSEATGEAFFGVPVENPRDMYDLLCAMPETAVGVGVNTLVYSFASEDCGVDASFRAIRYGYDTYWTEFLVPRDGGITQLSDLNGKSWVYPSPTLTSYYYVALAVMAEAGVTPGDAFDAGSSTAAVSAVYYREADFGTVFYSPYVDVDGAIQWDFDPANADLPDISDCHFVTEAVGAFAEGDLVCGPTGGVWPDEYLEVRDARRTAEAPDIVDEVRILTLSPGVPNDAVAFGAEFDTDLRASVEDALRLFADEASPHFEAVWLPSLDLLYRWDGINDADDSDWDWIRPRLHGLFSIDDL